MSSRMGKDLLLMEGNGIVHGCFNALCGQMPTQLLAPLDSDRKLMINVICLWHPVGQYHRVLQLLSNEELGRVRRRGDGYYQ